jgi:formylmethanofuran dehydrogenase subunit A
LTSTLIKGGHVIDPETGMDGLFDIVVENGTIQKVEKPKGKKKSAKGKGKRPQPELIDASGRIVTPGLIRRPLKQAAWLQPTGDLQPYAACRIQTRSMTISQSQTIFSKRQEWLEQCMFALWVQ